MASRALHRRERGQSAAGRHTFGGGGGPLRQPNAGACPRHTSRITRPAHPSHVDQVRKGRPWRQKRWHPPQCSEGSAATSPARHPVPQPPPTRALLSALTRSFLNMATVSSFVANTCTHGGTPREGHYRRARGRKNSPSLLPRPAPAPFLGFESAAAGRSPEPERPRAGPETMHGFLWLLPSLFIHLLAFTVRAYAVGGGLVVRGRLMGGDASQSRGFNSYTVPWLPTPTAWPWLQPRPEPRARARPPCFLVISISEGDGADRVWGLPCCTARSVADTACKSCGWTHSNLAPPIAPCGAYGLLPRGCAVMHVAVPARFLLPTPPPRRSFTNPSTSCFWGWSARTTRGAPR